MPRVFAVRAWPTKTSANRRRSRGSRFDGRRRPQRPHLRGRSVQHLFQRLERLSLCARDSGRGCPRTWGRHRVVVPSFVATAEGDVQIVWLLRLTAVSTCQALGVGGSGLGTIVGSLIRHGPRRTPNPGDGRSRRRRPWARTTPVQTKASQARLCGRRGVSARRPTERGGGSNPPGSRHQSSGRGEAQRSRPRGGGRRAESHAVPVYDEWFGLCSSPQRRNRIRREGAPRDPGDSRLHGTRCPRVSTRPGRPRAGRPTPGN